ncbi:MAG: hypothetical protein DRP01_03240 [Archaeoglobales archaeon]|nr:MAG: hypothetical protein DRP01_03240 [Archaeoglobales archaeon]
MPLRYVCSNCGYVLYDSKKYDPWKLKGMNCFGLPTPSEVIRYYNGRCPKCGKKLRKPDLKDIVIKEKK